MKMFFSTQRWGCDTPSCIFIYRWWLFRLGAIYCTASKILSWYIPEIMKIRKETNLLTWRYSTDSTGIRRSFSITNSTWLDLFQVPERMAWISKQPTMSCQRPFGSRNRTNCRSIKAWKSLAVQTWTDHKDIESPLLIPCPSDDSSSRKCAEHRFVPSTSSDPKVSQQPVHSIWIPQTIRRWSYKFIETFWSTILGTMEHQCASRGSTVAPLFISNLGKVLCYVFLASIEREPRLDSPLQKTAWPPPVIPLTVWRCVVVPSSCITKGPRTGSNGTSSCELPTATTTDLLFCFFWLLLKWNNSWCCRRKPSHVPWFLGMSEVQNEKSWF